MAKRILTYRSLTREVLDGFSIPEESLKPTLSYPDGDIPHLIRLHEDQRAYYISGNDSDWNPAVDNLLFCENITMSNAAALYHGDGQVAYEDSKLSLAMFVVAPQSSSQFLLCSQEIEDTDKEQEICLAGVLKKGKFRGDIECHCIIVLTKPGIPKDVFGVNNTPGVKLGELFSYKIRLSSNGSSFPAYEKSVPGGTLWYTECDWQEVAYDQFLETFSFVINPANPDYVYLDKKNKSYCPRLENEIMAEAIADFLIAVNRDSTFSANIKDQYDEGTVAATAQYMIETKGIDINKQHDGIVHQIAAIFEKEETHDDH